MDFEEHEDQEEEMEMPTPIYQKLGSTGGGDGGGGEEGGSTTRKSSIRYKECQKNHAVHISGHAVDGCLEFMAAGEEGTLDALKCAACNCHRNFHRKETDSGGNSVGGGYGHHLHLPPPQSISPYNYRPPTPSGYLHLTPSTHRPPPMTLVPSEEDVSNPSSSGGGGGGSSKKRFRTKFTQEQKDKMLELAERIGWRIQKHDESVVEQFCVETGVKRQVFKVWMHNNKNTLGKKP